MKGIVLAGGLGTRLSPLTRVTNKHLLPVYDRPMIYYPIEALVRAGITDILLVTGGEHAGDFLKLLRDGRELGVKHLEYAYQEGNGGIADALKQGEDFAEGGKVCVVLGDNIFGGPLGQAIEAFEQQPQGARFLLKEVDDASRYGVARLADGKLVEIVEKPQQPPSRFAATGIYFYDAQVFGFCRDLRPGPRGELEITDVNNRYCQLGQATYDTLEGWWTDAGTFESLFLAGQLVREKGANRQTLSETGKMF